MAPNDARLFYFFGDKRRPNEKSSSQSVVIVGGVGYRSGLVKLHVKFYCAADLARSLACAADLARSLLISLLGRFYDEFAIICLIGRDFFADFEAPYLGEFIGEFRLQGYIWKERETGYIFHIFAHF